VAGTGFGDGFGYAVADGIVESVASAVAEGVVGGVAGWTEGGIAVGTRADGRRPLADVKVTQKYLVPLSLDGKPIKDGARAWRLTLEAHSLTFTMRNEPRSGIANADPGIATVTFTPETGHVYEVEIRAAADAYSSRVWKKGDWKPVVRDRTADRIVSTEPTWRESGASPAADPDGAARTFVDVRVAKKSTVAVRREEKIR
jgi:hypothetical protein